MALRFRWIVPRVLAGMERPGSYHSVAEDLAFLRSKSIAQVLSLTERPLDESAFRGGRIEVHHLPVPDFEAPTEDQVEEIVSLVDRAEARGEATLVHCLAGLGRTGTIAACYLARRYGWDGVAALRAAREVEPGYVQSQGQEDFVVAFASTRTR